MAVKFHSSVIFTDDLEKSKHFYTNLLGQEIEVDYGNCIVLKCGLSLWKMSEGHKIRKSIPHGLLEKGNKFEICFETDNFEEIEKIISDKNIPLVHSRNLETWGQYTIRIFDPDNNIVEIGETLDTFIKRLNASGLSIEEVNKITSVPVERIEKII